jgi:hypothetical protein
MEEPMFSRPPPFIAATAVATLLIGLESPWATAGPLPSWTYSTSFEPDAAGSNDDPRDPLRMQAWLGFQGVSGAPGKTAAPIVIGTTILPDLVTTLSQMSWSFDPASNLVEAQIQITDANHQSGSATFGFRVGGELIGTSYSGQVPIPPNRVELSYTLNGASSQVVPIGGNLYTVSFGTIDWGHYFSTLDTPTGGTPVPGALTASVSVAPINNAPEPSGLLLAVMGLAVSAGLIRRRRPLPTGEIAKGDFMKRLLRMSVLVFLLGMPSSTSAANLEEVPRTIDREPAYQTSNPQYCLLVFGPRATTRIWLVLDGDTLYVDRNGELREPNKKVTLPPFKPIHTTQDKPEESERQVSFSIDAGPGARGQLLFLQVRLRKDFIPKKREDAQYLARLGGRLDTFGVVLMTGDLKELFSGGPGTIQTAMEDQAGMLLFADRPQDAPILHFNGPVQMRLQSDRALVRGEASFLIADMGTPGLGNGSFVLRDPGLFRGHVHPIAEIEFPARQPGGVPIKQRVALDQCGCGSQFRGLVHVPKDVGLGQAKVTVSFTAWKEGKVATTREEILVITGSAVEGGGNPPLSNTQR